MKVLLMRFDAPLLSFGGTVIDTRNVTDEMPSRSMITGLLGNALGYEHRDVDALGKLQSRLRVAARRDVPGERVIDYQTVDLGQAFMTAGWTSWGKPEGREGGSAASGTHIRYRHLLADAAYTVAVTLVPRQETPDLSALASALDEPARPLFVGRKACLPSGPLKLGDGIVEAGSLLDALRDAPLARRHRSRRAKLDEPRLCLVRIPAQDAEEGFSERAVTEDRDWPNQIHVGRTIVLERIIMCGAGAGARS